MTRPPSSQAARRRRKTPARRDAGNTRARLLEAAIAAFAKDGYSGARVEAICKAARANPRMLYHHFGDKDGLYVAVLEHVIEELRRAELQLDIDHVEPLEGMLLLYEFVSGHFGKHPELLALLTGENLLGGRFLRRSTSTPVVSSPVLALVRRLLERGERDGVIRPDLDPLHVYVLMVSLTYFHRSNAHTLSTIFRTPIDRAGWQTKHRRLGADVLLRFLRAP